MFANYYRIICEEQAMYYLEEELGYYEKIRYEGYNMLSSYNYKKIANNLYELRLTGYNYEYEFNKLFNKYPNTTIYKVDYNNKKESIIKVVNAEIKEINRDIYYESYAELLYKSFEYNDEWINYLIAIDEIDEKYYLIIEDFNNNKSIKYDININNYNKYKEKLFNMLENKEVYGFIESDNREGEHLEINYEYNPDSYENVYLSIGNSSNEYYSKTITYEEISKIKEVVNNLIKEYQEDYLIKLKVNRKISSKLIKIDEIDNDLYVKINELIEFDYLNKYKSAGYHNTIIFYLDNKFIGFIGYEYDYDVLLVTEAKIIKDELEDNINLIEEEFKKNIDNKKYSKIKYACEKIF